MGPWGWVVSLLIIARAPALEIVATRALDDRPRTSLLLVLRNATAAPVTIESLDLAGQPVEELLRPADSNRPTSPGVGLDWWDVRPATLAPGAEGALLLGYTSPAVREPELRLTILTDRGRFALTAPPPVPDQLKVAAAGFDADLRRLRLLLRNDGETALTPRAIRLNGRLVTAPDLTAELPPGELRALTLELPAPPTYGDDCVLRVEAEPAGCAVWFRAHPAESLTVMYWGHHADRRWLRELAIDVPGWRTMPHAEHAREIEAAGGRIEGDLARRLTATAERVGGDPTTWGWYLQDDAGWGRPRPQTLVTLGRFLRAHGSRQPQILCNPADWYRYAWLADIYLNYHYHATGAGDDPTVFPEWRSLEGLRLVNEPAPIAYLVDGVGQKHRWLTPAELELASLAMLGRGARYLGWFLGPSVWEQGTTLHGGIDPLETLPWRFLEGVTGNVQIGRRIGDLARLFRALAPSLAVSAPAAGVTDGRRFETLPILCADGTVILVVLNRYLRCGWPGDEFQGVKLVPQRVTERLIARYAEPGDDIWLIDPRAGARRIESAAKLELDLETGVLVVIRPRKPADLAELGRPTVSRPALRPDVIQPPDLGDDRGWRYAAGTFRAVVRATGPLTAGQLVRVELPEPGAETIGYFAGKVSEFGPEGLREVAGVDAIRVPEPAQWLARGDAARVTVTSEGRVTRVSATYGRERPGEYGRLEFGGQLDPAYDLLGFQRDFSGRLEPLLSYTLEVDGRPVQRTLNLRPWLERGARPYSRLLPAVGPRGLPEVVVRWRELVRAEEQRRADGQPDAPVTALALSAQIYDGLWRLGPLVQRRSQPVVLLRVEADVPAGAAWSRVITWDCAPLPPARPWPRETAPATISEGRLDPVEAVLPRRAEAVWGEGVLADLGLWLEALQKPIWVEARTAAGELVDRAPLELPWEQERHGLTRPLAVADGPVTAWYASAGGRVVAVPLRPGTEPPALAEFARVEGQVEALAVAPDGAWLLVGAAGVTALDAGGGVRWRLDVGEQRRQPEHFGPGRNVEAVAIAPDGRTGAVKTFRWDAATRRYADSVVRRVTPAGPTDQLEAVDWREPLRLGGAPESEPPFELPPYPLHRLPLPDGRWVIATTQGLVRCCAADGRNIWEVTRPSRIDDCVPVAGRLALAWKAYLHDYDWTARPTLELLDLTNGRTEGLWRGPAADDWGHFGTPLRLAVAGTTVFMGDQTGRLYRREVTP